MGERVRVRAVLRRWLPSSAPPAGGGTFSPIGEKGSTFYINYMWNPFRRVLFRSHSKEITGDVWLNITSLSNAARKAATDRTPLRFDGELSGIVTLIHFWDYSSVDSIEDLPYLHKWWEMYECPEFVIIGIHTPQFAFAKDADKVGAAVLRFHLDYPILSDSEYTTWKRYGTTKWPRKILVDAQGIICLDHNGKGGHEDIETKIHELLEQVKRGSEFIHPGNVVTPSISLSRESLGMRGVALSPLNESAEYHIPNKIPLHSIALSGWWITGEKALASGALSDTQACIIHFYGSACMGHIRSAGTESATVQIYINNKKIGEDVVIATESEYTFVSGLPAASHQLTIIPIKGNIAISSVSFS